MHRDATTRAEATELATFDDLRARLAHDDQLWLAVTTRLSAFARLEQLADARATTPEALALRAAVARDEVRLQSLRQDVAAAERELSRLEAIRAERAVEVEDLTTARDQLLVEICHPLDTGERLDRCCIRPAAGGGVPIPAGVSPVAVLLAEALDPSVDDDEANAFAAFFDAELEHDKSRAWILSEGDDLNR